MKISAGTLNEKSVISHQFAKAVRTLIKDKKAADVKALCEKYGYQKGLIRNVETGMQEAPKDFLYGIVIDFNLNPGYFFPNKGEEPELYIDCQD